MTSDKDQSCNEDQSAEHCPPACSCAPDPFADLPLELRPRPHRSRGNLRQARCPVCGLEYQTNRKGDVCMMCERAGSSAR